MAATSTLDPVVMRAEKRRVALYSVWAAVLITALKLVVGFQTHSLGVLSEALHSGLDLIAAAITLFSVRVSDLPPDATHQYGHGKVENFSAFLETGLLLLTCVWIIWEAVHRLRGDTVHVEPTIWAFAVMVVSIIIDHRRSRELRKIARKYDSQALEADALHFSTDVWSSAVVILGLILVWLGDHYQIPWMAKADPVAALIVAGIVIYVSWRLARQTVDALLDAAPSGIRSRILDAVSAVDGVLEVDRVRIRRAGNSYFADVSVGLSRNVTFARSGLVVGEVENAVKRVLPDADVVVNSMPRTGSSENIFDRIRGAAARHNFGVHDISVQQIEGRTHVEMHLELDEKLALKAAHDLVTQVEGEIMQEIPEINSILTHIESEPATVEAGDAFVQDKALTNRLIATAADFPEVIGIHDLVLKRVRGKLYASCHCVMPDHLSLARVHEISTALEARFKQIAPQIFKVLIHNEPSTDHRRSHEREGKLD